MQSGGGGQQGASHMHGEFALCRAQGTVVGTPNRGLPSGLSLTRQTDWEKAQWFEELAGIVKTE